MCLNYCLSAFIEYRYFIINFLSVVEILLLLMFFVGGRHAMALTVDGKVFSWGEGEDGKLGHFSRLLVYFFIEIYIYIGTTSVYC